MNQKELKELIDYLVEKDIAEFEFERGDVKVHVKRAAAIPAPQYAPAVVPQFVPAEPHFVTAPPAAPTSPAQAAPTPAAAAAPAPAAPSAEAAEEAGLHIVRSPIVGTFYEAPSPGAPPFVKVGDNVSEGQVMCIIEAMKLMNEIECDRAGEIVKKYVVNAQPVEYGQPLFGIRSR